MEEQGEKYQLINAWHTLMKKGTDFDLWGQPVEANESYKRLIGQLEEQAGKECSIFSDEERKVLDKVVTCLELRSKTLHNPGRIEGISLDDLKLIANKLHMLITNGSKDFPVDVTALQESSRDNVGFVHQEQSADESDISALDAVSERKFKGTLHPRLPAAQGQTRVAVRVDKIGLKDATQYLESYISVSLRDGHGTELSAIQDTPQASHKDDTHVYFGVNVHLQTYLESLPEDVALFFEFKHYKPKKKQLSTKCWAFMEKDEIKEGQTVIELYKKPTDYKRKKINLLTVKPLYLHMKLTFDS